MLLTRFLCPSSSFVALLLSNSNLITRRRMMTTRTVEQSRPVWHIFWDLQCPYARQHWRRHRHELEDAFQDQYEFQIHLTSLAFHAQAFPGQCAAVLLEQEKGAEARLQFIDACFEHQDEYNNAALPDPTKSDIKRAFATIAQRVGLLDDEEEDDDDDEDDTTGKKLTFSEFVTRMDDWEKVVQPAYAEHKFALRHGVFGTPKHVIDGKVVPDTESTWGVDKWKAKLDSLMKEKSSVNTR